MKKTDRRVRFEEQEKEIQEEYRRKLEALYTLYPEYASSASTNMNGNENSSGNFTNVIRRLLESHKGETFTHDKATAWLRESDPILANEIDNVTIPNTLARLAKRKEIEKISPDGERPAIYRVKKDTPPTAFA